MDVFRKSNLTDLELTQLNYCRYFLQIEFVSAITTSDGTYLIPAVYTQRNGEPLQHQNNTMHWPRQGTLSAKIWRFWNKQILRFFSTRHSWLPKPLGQWIRVIKHWTNYWDPKTNTILRNTNN
eukprot:12204975-Ditylum_brightwellii.AAC.1